MKDFLQNQDLKDRELSDRHLITFLRQALKASYARLRTLARHEWERRHPGKDPSDDSVSVTISQYRNGAPKQNGAAISPKAKIEQPPSTN